MALVITQVIDLRHTSFTIPQLSAGDLPPCSSMYQDHTPCKILHPAPSLLPYATSPQSYSMAQWRDSPQWLHTAAGPGLSLGNLCMISCLWMVHWRYWAGRGLMHLPHLQAMHQYLVTGGTLQGGALRGATIVWAIKEMGGIGHVRGSCMGSILVAHIAI